MLLGMGPRSRGRASAIMSYTMKPLHCLSWLGCCLVLIAATGCKGSNKLKVAFVTNNPDPWWNIAEAGANKAAAEEDVELLFRKPTPGNATTQKEEIDGAVNQGVKAVAVSVFDPKNQTAYLDKVASKVPV